MNGLDPAGIEELRELIRALVDEGRTVVLSSHLLSEVERTCDAVAIVDQGRVVAQGSLEELRTDGAPTLFVASMDNTQAGALLARHASVDSVAPVDGGLRVRLRPGTETVARETAADINRRLVEAGIRVHRLEPQHASLEQRFLEITSRLEEAA
jgi:ABC-2 type transport system ATP-binding protein